MSKKFKNKSLSTYLFFMQALRARPYRKEFKLDPEIVLEELYRAGSLMEDRHGHIKPKYYPKSLSINEIIEKTKLPENKVSHILNFFCSHYTWSEPKEPLVKEVMIEGIEKYQITDFGIRLLKVLGSRLSRDEYDDDENFEIHCLNYNNLLAPHLGQTHISVL